MAIMDHVKRLRNAITASTTHMQYMDYADELIKTYGIDYHDACCVLDGHADLHANDTYLVVDGESYLHANEDGSVKVIPR